MGDGGVIESRDMVCCKRVTMDTQEGERIKPANSDRRRKRMERRNILEQYRKLRLVLPNINTTRGKISKQSVVEEAILYIEELQRQLKYRMEATEDRERQRGGGDTGGNI